MNLKCVPFTLYTVFYNSYNKAKWENLTNKGVINKNDGKLSMQPSLITPEGSWKPACLFTTSKMCYPLPFFCPHLSTNPERYIKTGFQQGPVYMYCRIKY